MADTKKMTTRDFLKAVLSNEITPEVLGKAQELIDKLDEANAKRKDAPKKPSKASIENAPIADAIEAYLVALGPNTPALAKDIAAAVGQTVQKASAVLKAMVEDGRAVRTVPDNRNKPIEYSAPAVAAE